MVASDWNLWRSLESMLLLQQLNCVSMFYLCPVSNKLKVSVLSKFYAITIKIIIITLLAISMTYFRCFTLVLSLLPQGFLWKLLTGYELISVSVHCVLNIILLFVTKEKQMQFLQRINKIDQTIAHEFDDRVDHKRYRQALAYAIVVFTFYYYGLVLTASYIAYYFKKYILILFAWIYESQHIMLASITYTCTNYIFLIYVRFNLLLRICQRLQTDFATPTISDDEKQQRVHKLQKLFKLFKELSESVKMIDDFSGWNLLLAMIQDFTLSLIQWYLLFHIIWEKQELSREYYVIGILYWSLGTFAKVIALGTATNLAISQVLFKNYHSFLLASL